MTTTQIALPGQTHVAEGPHDQTGMYLMHHAFRRDLDRFERAVRRTPVAEAPVWRALAARWERFAVVLHHHHTIEDDHIWPVLTAASTGSPEDRATLAAMEAEHEQIDPGLAACSDAFAAMADCPCEEHRGTLVGSVTGVHAALLDHLRHEETEALPLLQRVMTEEEFAASEAAAAKGYPPRMIPFLVPWVFDGVPTEVSGPYLAKAGRAYALVLRALRGRHARAEQRAFGHA